MLVPGHLVAADVVEGRTGDGIVEAAPDEGTPQVVDIARLGRGKSHLYRPIAYRIAAGNRRVDTLEGHGAAAGKRQGEIGVAGGIPELLVPGDERIRSGGGRDGGRGLPRRRRAPEGCGR